MCNVDCGNVTYVSIWLLVSACAHTGLGWNLCMRGHFVFVLQKDNWKHLSGAHNCFTALSRQFLPSPVFLNTQQKVYVCTGWYFQANLRHLQLCPAGWVHFVGPYKPCTGCTGYTGQHMNHARAILSAPAVYCICGRIIHQGTVKLSKMLMKSTHHPHWLPQQTRNSRQTAQTYNAV